MENFNRTWAEVDLSAIEENYRAVRLQTGDSVKIMAVVKADAYGHGVRRVAPLLERLGADYFAVSCLQEAMELRALGIRRPILILGYTDPAFFDRLLAENIEQAVFDPADAEKLSRVAAAQGKNAKIHAALDTGMGRIGFDAFDPVSAAAQVLRIAALPHLELTGLFTHFSVADDESGAAYTEAQFRRFLAVRDLLAEKGLHPLCHAANSAAAFSGTAYHLDMVRAGIMLYGLEPGGRKNPFQPAMAVKTIVTFIKELPAGRSVSYGRRYETNVPRRVATLAAGYADGYPRALSQKGVVQINGHAAPILGTVCMDQMMADVTDIPCRVGDEALLMGGAVSWDRLAEQLNTIHYELICGISKRVPRIYIEKIKI